MEASDLAAGRRRRRLTQAAVTSQLKYTIVVMIPYGRDASEVGARRCSCCGMQRCPLPAGACRLARGRGCCMQTLDMEPCLAACCMHRQSWA